MTMTSTLFEKRVEAVAEVLYPEMSYSLDVCRSVAREALEAADEEVTEEMIADELKRHHFIHGLSRRNSCHCGVEVGEFEQYRNHEAQAVKSLFRGGAK